MNLQLEAVKKRLQKKGIQLDISKEALTLLAKQGFDPIFGARPLKRLIQSTILDELSMRIIEGKAKEGSIAKVDVRNGNIVVV